MAVKVSDGSGRGGITGVFNVVPREVRDELTKNGDIMVTCEVQGQDKKCLLTVPIGSEAKEVLKPFTDNWKSTPTDEEGLRSFLGRELGGRYECFVKDGFVSNVQAPEGPGIFTLRWMSKFTRRSDNADRVRFVAEDRRGRVVTWTGSWPKVRDGNDLVIAKGHPMWQHLFALGLNLDQFVTEAEAAPSLWDDDYDREGHPVEAFFPADNPAKAFMDAIGRHGKKSVQINVVRHERYGLGPERTAEFPVAILTPVVVEEADPAMAEFAKESAYFEEIWSNLTSLFLGREARFLAAGKPTEDGMLVARKVIVPAVNQWPAVVNNAQKPDGTARIVFPLSPEGWDLDGLVCLDFLAERLMNDKDINIHEPNGVMDDPDKLLAWAAENVPEFENIGQMEGVEL